MNHWQIVVTIFSKHLNKVITMSWLTNPGYPDWTSSWGCPCRVLVRGERSEDWCGAGLVWGGWRWSDATPGPVSTLGPGNNKTCDKPLVHFCMITLCQCFAASEMLPSQWQCLVTFLIIKQWDVDKWYTHTHDKARMEYNIVKGSANISDPDL